MILLAFLGGMKRLLEQEYDMGTYKKYEQNVNVVVQRCNL